MNERVLNRRDGFDPLTSAYVGRPSRWGNPFAVNHRRTRAEAIAAFRVYAVKRLRAEPDWLDDLHGRQLVCWCAPLVCHAEVLIELGA
jgi:hypothetical protein